MGLDVAIVDDLILAGRLNNVNPKARFYKTDSRLRCHAPHFPKRSVLITSITMLRKWTCAARSLEPAFDAGKRISSAPITLTEFAVEFKTSELCTPPAGARHTVSRSMYPWVKITR